MSDNELRRWINLLNNNKYQDSIFIKQINESVYFGHVWDKMKNVSQCMDNRHDVYFIHKEDKFVGCVYYGGSDIHIYVLPKYRRQGLMKRNLKEVILPHLFYYYNKKSQRVTSHNPNAIKLLLDLGFIPFEDGYLIKQSDLPKFEESHCSKVLNALTYERVKLLRSRLEKAIVEIAKVSDELSINYYENEKLSNLIRQNLATHCIPRDMFDENRNWE